MKMDILSRKNENKGSVDLPSQFNEPVRPDLIKKAVLVVAGNNRQPYGAKPNAGMRASAELSRRRHDYRGSYTHGISRVPRKIMSRRGTRMNWVGAFAPGTVGGRRAHPPKAEKIWELKMNKKERRKAIRSALAAVVDKATISKRGHKIPENFPVAIDDDFESIKKTKDVVASLEGLGLKDELKRCAEKKVRAGKGASRGRKYKKKIGPLIVVSKDCALIKSAVNIPGVEVLIASDLNAASLAPGTLPGRLTLFTKSAIGKIRNEKLFE